MVNYGESGCGAMAGGTAEGGKTPPPVAPRGKTPPKVAPKVAPAVAPRAKTPPKAAAAADAAAGGETFDFKTLLTTAALAPRSSTLAAEEAARKASALRAGEAPGDVENAKKQLTPEAPKTPEASATPTRTVSPKLLELLTKFVDGGNSDAARTYWDKSTRGSIWEKVLLCLHEGCSNLIKKLTSAHVPDRTLKIFIGLVDTDGQPPVEETARCAFAAALSELTETFDELKRMLTAQGDVPAEVAERAVVVCSEVDSQYEQTLTGCVEVGGQKVLLRDLIVKDTIRRYRTHAQTAADLAVLKDAPAVPDVLELLDPTAPVRKARQEMLAAGADFSQQPRADEPRKFADSIRTKCGEQRSAIETLLGRLRDAHRGEPAYVNETMDNLELAQKALGSVHYDAESTAAEAWPSRW